MPSTVSYQRLAKEIEHRTVLLATGLNHGEHTLNKLTARIGLRAMRGAPPDDGMPQRTLSTVVGGFHARRGDKTPQYGFPIQQLATGGRRA